MLPVFRRERITIYQDMMSGQLSEELGNIVKNHISAVMTAISSEPCRDFPALPETFDLTKIFRIGQVNG